jgi:hypothetical protein
MVHGTGVSAVVVARSLTLIHDTGVEAGSSVIWLFGYCGGVQAVWHEIGIS